MNHQIPTGIPDLVLINKKKRTCHPIDFIVPADHKVKIKESGQINEPCQKAKYVMEHS